MFDSIIEKHFSNPLQFPAALKLLQQYDLAQNKYPNWPDFEASFLSKLEDDESELLEKAISCRDEQREFSHKAQSFDLDGVLQEIKKLNPSNNLKSIPLSECLDNYIAEARRNWQKNSAHSTEIKDYRPKIQTFIEIIGDLQSADVTKAHIVQYKNTLFALPANRNKIKAYKEKTIQELLELDIPKEDRLQDSTLLNNLHKVATFLKWCARNNYMIQDLNEPFEGSIKRKRSEDEERDAFSTSDLGQLFGSRQYMFRAHEEASHYWIPLLGLLTGARQNELCQLHVADIYEAEGIHVIDINANNPSGTAPENQKRIKRPWHARVFRILCQSNRLNFQHTI